MVYRRLITRIFLWNLWGSVN